MSRLRPRQAGLQQTATIHILGAGETRVIHFVLPARGSLAAASAVALLSLAVPRATSETNLPSAVDPAGAPQSTGFEGVARAVAPQAQPGAFQVDEDEVTRALERALVLEGAQLLPPGSLQIQPNVSYARDEDDAPFLLVEGVGDNAQVVAAEKRSERDFLETSLTLRAGLPYESQVEITLPYRLEKTSTTVRVDFSDRSETSESADGLGDIRIGFTKALLRERGQVPGLFGKVFWGMDTGEIRDSGALGSGFNELGGSLTVIRTQDPLVFIGSLSYEHSLEDGGIQPGDAFGVSAGMALAVSPETSWRVSLEQTFQQETESAGRRIQGSDRTIGMLSLGVSTLLARGAFLDITAGIGLTDSAPDYSVSISTPIRLSSIL